MERTKPTVEQLKAYLNGDMKNPEMGSILGTTTKHGTVMSVMKHLKNHYQVGKLKIK